MLRTLGLALLPLLAGGCALESQVTVRFTQGSPPVVEQSATVKQTVRRVHGRTTRRGQVVRIECQSTIAYDVRESTGTAVLVQSYHVHLRTPRLGKGTPYDLQCAGPLIVEVPGNASALRATAKRSGEEIEFPVAPVTSVPLGFRKRLHAERGTYLAVLNWPRRLGADDHLWTLSFTLPELGNFQERALSTASVSCGGATYLQPILPVATRMAQTPLFTIHPSASAVDVTLPRIAGGFRTDFAVTQRLSCGR
jgi:hypothetical protein